MSKLILTSYDFNQNEIQNAVIQVLASAPSTPVEGQVYYDSTLQALQVRLSGSWFNTGGVGISDGDKGDITVSASGATWTIDNDAVTYAKIQNVVANNVFLGNNSGAGGIIDELTGTEATAMLDLFSTVATTKGLVPGSNGATTTFLRGDLTWASPAGGFADFTAGGDSGIDQTVNSGDLLEVLGDTGITTTISKVSTTVSILVDLDDTIVTPGSYGSASQVSTFTVDQQGRLTAAGNSSISITASQINDLLDDDTFATASATTAASSESIKAYVDSSIVGALVYQGGYNAATNTPDLDTAPSGINQGFVYVVSAAGTFFTEDVQVGDMLFSETNNPTVLTDWTVVNKNIPDIVSASETAEGIIELATQTEVNTGADTTRAVTPATLQSKLGVTGTLNSTLRFTQQIGDTAATNIVVTHNIGRQFVTAQVFETASPFAQIECDIEMDSTTQTSFTFNVAPGTNEYTVVIVG